MQLTEHFALEEFSLDGEMPDQCVPVYKSICELILEPVRAHFNEEVIVTSGYRPPAANAAAHGVKDSQHMATNVYGAADFKIRSLEKDMRPVFDWIRESSEIPYDQAILEHDPSIGTDVIHVSWSRAHNRREAMEGETSNLSAYTAWPSNPLGETA